MLTSAIVAVALGLAPVNHDGSVDIARVNSAAIGQYTQSTDARGTTRISGRDARGHDYELIVDPRGHVEARVGDHVVWFDISERA